MIPYSRQSIDEIDIKALTKVLKSDFLTQGPCNLEFEHALKKFSKANYATTMNSATSALHAACLALGASKGDIIWTVPNTFVATANCALYCGADIDFVDIDPKTFNISIHCLEEKLKQAKKNGNLPKILIPVHFAGEPSDLKQIKDLSKKYGFFIIEDGSHSVGSFYKKSKIGSCEFSDITIYSFHAVKIITTGEGGAALTNCAKLDRKLKLYRSHGVTRDKNLYQNQDDAAWYYEQICLGFNYRMTDIQAALGITQLEKINIFFENRSQIAARYDKSFKDTNLTTQLRSTDNRSSLHLYVIQVEKEKRKTIFNLMRKKEIMVNVHYIPIHLQPFYKNLGFKHGDFPVAENYYARSISLPIFPDLKSEEQNRVIETVKNLINA